MKEKIFIAITFFMQSHSKFLSMQKTKIHELSSKVNGVNLPSSILIRLQHTAVRNATPKLTFDFIHTII